MEVEATPRPTRAMRRTWRRRPPGSARRSTRPRQVTASSSATAAAARRRAARNSRPPIFHAARHPPRLQEGPGACTWSDEAADGNQLVLVKVRKRIQSVAAGCRRSPTAAAPRARGGWRPTSAERVPRHFFSATARTRQIRPKLRRGGPGGPAASLEPPAAQKGRARRVRAAANAPCRRS